MSYVKKKLAMLRLNARKFELVQPSTKRNRVLDLATIVEEQQLAGGEVFVGEDVEEAGVGVKKDRNQNVKKKRKRSSVSSSFPFFSAASDTANDK